MAHDVRNCRRCGKIFVYVGVPVCEECLKKEEEQYATVRRYLDEHPRAGVRETSDATGVPVDIVMEFVRQGLLVTSTGPRDDLIACAICGNPIQMGRVCPKCQAALLSVTGKPTRASGDDKPIGRMYSMDMIHRRK